MANHVSDLFRVFKAHWSLENASQLQAPGCGATARLDPRGRGLVTDHGNIGCEKMWKTSTSWTGKKIHHNHNFSVIYFAAPIQVVRCRIIWQKWLTPTSTIRSLLMPRSRALRVTQGVMSFRYLWNGNVINAFLLCETVSNSPWGFRLNRCSVQFLVNKFLVCSFYHRFTCIGTT